MSDLSEQSNMMHWRKVPWTCPHCNTAMKAGGKRQHLIRCQGNPDHLLWPRIDVDHSSGCWVYTGACDRRGYGRPGKLIDGKKVRYYAHRRIYELLVGPIPPGALVLHKCDNPPCCKPSHLFLGDDGTNSLDKWLKQRGTPKQLSPDTVRAIRKALETDTTKGHTFRIGQQFGVLPNVISGIKHRKKYWYVE